MDIDPRQRPGALGPLERRLHAQPSAFEFSQGIALLERLALLDGRDIRPVGTQVWPEREALRLEGPLRVEFGLSALTGLIPAVRDPQTPKRPARPTLQTGFMGLGGADGPLPYAYQDWLQEALRSRDAGPRDFLNIFQHRLLALLHRAQAHHRSVEPFTPPGHGLADRLSLALMGQDPPVVSAPALHASAGAAPRPEAVPPMPWAAVFAERRRSLAGFVELLKEQLGIEVRATPFTGGWLPLSPADRTRLGRHAVTGEARISARTTRPTLGRGTLLGRRVWDEHEGITLTLGPMPADVLADCRPTGARHARLRQLASQHLGPCLRVHLRLLGHPVKEAAHTRLQSGGGETAQGPSMRLGRNARLGRMGPLPAADWQQEERLPLQTDVEWGHQ